MPKVIIYTTPTCIYCKMAKEFFDKNDIGYEERDVSESDVARSEMIDKSNQMGVPVIEVDGKIIVGFDQKKLSGLLGM